MKNTYLKTSFVLGMICAVAAVLLAFVNLITKPVIDVNEEKAMQEAREAVSCGMQVGNSKEIQKDDFKGTVTELLQNGTTSGYIIETSTNGYGGKIELTAGYDSEGRILAVKIGTNSETPGVGKRYENSQNLKMFIGTGSDNAVPANKKALSDEDSVLVTGATVSFNGISKALTEGSFYVKSLKGGKI